MSENFVSYSRTGAAAEAAWAMFCRMDGLHIEWPWEKALKSSWAMLLGGAVVQGAGREDQQEWREWEGRGRTVPRLESNAILETNRQTKK